MKKTRLLCLCLAFFACIMAYPVSASDSPAYKQLLAENPVYVKDVTLDELYGFYENSSVDEIFDPAENNFTKGDVTVGGVPVECYVYMRTFSITDISKYTIDEAKALADKIFSSVKSSLSSKYIKCIARSYSINISGVPDKINNTYKSFTVKFLIATGESNEERAEVITGFVRPMLAQWEGFSEGDKFKKLNAFILNGQFSYDMSFFNRSSVYSFVTDKKGVCEEYAGLTALFLDEMGYKNRILTGISDGLAHVWNVVYINGRPYHLDILHNGPVDENGAHTAVLRDYLLVSTDAVMKNRIPDEKHSAICADAVYDYVFEGAPTHIPSEFFKIENGMMSHIPLFSSVSYMKAHLSLDGEFFKFIGTDGNEMKDEDNIGSGCKLVLEVNGGIIQSLTLCVDGDVDGNGVITDGDIALVKDVILRKNTETVLRFSPFCDINEDGAVTVSDFLCFSRLKDSIMTYHG